SSSATMFLAALVVPPVIAAVVFFQDASRKPSLEAGLGSASGAVPAFGVPIARCPSAATEALLRFQIPSPPSPGDWQPHRPIPAPSRNVTANVRLMSPRPPCLARGR